MKPVGELARTGRSDYSTRNRLRPLAKVQEVQNARNVPEIRKKGVSSPREAEIYSIVIAPDCPEDLDESKATPHDDGPRETRPKGRAKQHRATPPAQDCNLAARTGGNDVDEPRHEETHRTAPLAFAKSPGPGERNRPLGTYELSQYKRAPEQKRDSPASSSSTWPPSLSMANTTQMMLGTSNVPCGPFIGDWDPDLAWRTHQGNTPFDEKEVRRAGRGLDAGYHDVPLRRVFIACDAALHLRNQTTTDGDAVYRLLLRDATLSANDETGETFNLLHTQIEGVLYVREHQRQPYATTLTYPEPIAPDTPIAPIDPAALTTSRATQTVPSAEGTSSRRKLDDLTDYESSEEDWRGSARRRTNDEEGDEDVELEREVFGSSSEPESRLRAPRPSPTADPAVRRSDIPERPAAPGPGPTADQLATRPQITAASEAPLTISIPEAPADKIRYDLILADLTNLRLDC